MKKTTKMLLIVLAVLAIAVIVFGGWSYFGGPARTLKNKMPIVVSQLTDEREIALGTIIYPGAKIISQIQKDGSMTKASFEVPDSFDAVINTYAQDLLNRYPEFKATKQSIRKDEALNNLATVLTISSPTGKIIITSWPNLQGLTTFEILKDNNF